VLVDEKATLGFHQRLKGISTDVVRAPKDHVELFVGHFVNYDLARGRPVFDYSAGNVYTKEEWSSQQHKRQQQ
jgi:hypothetical protein